MKNEEDNNMNTPSADTLHNYGEVTSSISIGRNTKTWVLYNGKRYLISDYPGGCRVTELEDDDD
jgi:hypothetical protein